MPQRGTTGNALVPRRSIMTKKEILRVAYETGTSAKTVRNVLCNLNHVGVQRMSKARKAIAELLAKDAP